MTQIQHTVAEHTQKSMHVHTRACLSYADPEILAGIGVRGVAGVTGADWFSPHLISQRGSTGYFKETLISKIPGRVQHFLRWDGGFYRNL